MSLNHLYMRPLFLDLQKISQWCVCNVLGTLPKKVSHWSLGSVLGTSSKKGESKVCEFCVGYFEKSIESMVCGKDYFLLKSQDNRMKKSLTFSDNFQKSQFNYVNRLSAVILFDFRSKN